MNSCRSLVLTCQGGVKSGAPNPPGAWFARGKLGVWNAIPRELIAVTNTTVVNTETMCELPRKITALGLSGPITLALDNARYQRNAIVQALADQLGITLLSCCRTRPI